jgi:hybrid cluster-associated redox disulfide protein
LIDRVMVIHKNSTIKEILSNYPDTKKFFNEREMACSSCFAVNFDTLEKGALMHGLETNTLVDELNNFLKTLPTPISPLQEK